MSKAAAKTGLQPTALVAMEQFFPESERILRDDWANKMISGPMGGFVSCMKWPAFRNWMVRQSEKAIPGSWAGILCRKRYIDDQLLSYAGQYDAVVNLGAGFDTRAFRLDALRSVPVWEVDQQEIIAAKQKQLDQLMSEIPHNIRLVSVDFDRETIVDALLRSGYGFDTRTFFILEAVTQYLTGDGLSGLFSALSRAAKGSLLAFTYITGDFMAGRELYGAKRAYDQFVVRDKLWLCGKNAEEWETFLSQYGYAVVEHADMGAMTRAYITPTGRNLTISPLERIILARKAE
jgi:methyltransferase (TIGR00027 family)